MAVVIDSRAHWHQHGFDGEPGDLLAERSLVAAWSARWREHPDAVVLLDQQRSLTASDLDAASARVAGRLAAAGLGAGDRILMSCQPSVDLVVAHVGALRMGLTVVPVNTAFTSDEVANMARVAGVRLAVVDDPERVGDLWAIGPEIDLADGPVPPLDGAATDDPALIVFTSGTTGTPKGAVLTHGNLLASAVAVTTAWGWTRSDRLVLSLPLFHMHGLGVGVHGTLTVGASAVIVPRFSPDAVLDAARDHQATMFFGVPTMWVRLREHDRAGELARLRLCVSGSAPLAPDVFEDLAARTGQRIVERYGMSETAMNVSNPLHGERRAGSVGLALPGVEVRLGGSAEDPTGDPGADGVGEIQLRGPNVFPGYLDRPDATAEAFTGDGWFRTGDLGRVEAGGYLSIVGRSKDLIITGGYNVYPRDVEEVLRDHPAVVDVAVVGEPSAEWGETVTACVVAAPGTDPETLAAHAAAHLAGYQRPRRVVLVDDLPRNALGKVVKAELVRQISVG